MTQSTRVFILHRHSLFRDLVVSALAADARLDIIGATESRLEADRWVREEKANAAIVEIDPGFATDDDLRALFHQWSRSRGFVVLGAGFTEPRVDVYLRRSQPASAEDIASVLSAALN
ncbi:MAG: response regulator transcription factor [Chloroflexota bacterium]|nr:response regulator transcription factor [Chloroflexota bacterium]